MGSVTSEIKTYTYENGEIQRVQVVRFENFGDLKFIKPDYDPDSFVKLCSLYRDFIIQKYYRVFGKIVIYTLPEEAIPFENTFEGEMVSDSLAIVNMQFKKHIRCVKGELSFDDERVKAYFEKLVNSNCLYVAKGKRNTVTFLPVGREMGFLSKCHEAAELKVNSSFFVMDQFDCGSQYDRVGVPVGLMVENGVILNPPQFGREVFMVKDNGSISIESVSLKDLKVRINGITYSHGENASFYERPAFAKTPKGKTDIVVLNNKVVAINEKGKTQVPSGGFVVSVEGHVSEIADRTVSYEGLEDVKFALQVGNSAIVEGVPTQRFISPFYNFLKFYKTSYPPSMYPLNYEKARAPRIVLGADAEGKGMLLWFEGAGKFGYKPGEGSCGASLSEAAAIAKDLKMENGVHLDGGGSAQILLNNNKELQCSDRDPKDFSERERAIPVGIMIIG